MLHYYMIIYSPSFIFNFSFWVYTTVYTTYVHCISLEYYISLEHNILAHVARIFDISTSIHQEYTTYCWNYNIFIIGFIPCGWYSEVHSSHFILLLHDRTLMSTTFTAFVLCTPCTHCMCTRCTDKYVVFHCRISHLISRIRNVYILYVIHYMVHILLRIVFRETNAIQMNTSL